MIIAYINIAGVVERREILPSDPIPSGVVWVDLIEPTAEEEKFIEKALDIDTPTREEMDKFEVMSPFYREGNAYYMTITVLNKPDADYPDGVPITIILTSNLLITLRYDRPRSFNSFASRIMRSPELAVSAETIFEGLIDTLINRIADALEATGNELDSLLKNVFEKPADKKRSSKRIHNSTDYYNDIIKKVGRAGNLISKNRESLQSISRMLIFYSQSEHFVKREYRNRFRLISREVIGLTEYANFLSTRNAFMLDATLGMLSVEQNSIIKVFTVAAAVFMPPTLVASIYGMNFKVMPELEWVWGYPFAIIMIIVSALVPYYIFKRKGWL
jgi:magnesium transporter